MEPIRSARASQNGVAPAGVVLSQVTSLGTLARIARDPLTSIPEETRTQRMVVTRTFGKTKAYLCDPALIQEALVRQADHLAKSDEMKRVLGTALGEGLLTADGTAVAVAAAGDRPGFPTRSLERAFDLDDRRRRDDPRPSSRTLRRGDDRPRP